MRKAFGKIGEAVMAFVVAYVFLAIVCAAFGVCAWVLKSAVTAVGIPYGVARAVLAAISAVIAVYGVFLRRD